LQNISKPDAGDLIHAKPQAAGSDMTRPKKSLGWEPRVEFENGIKKKIEYFEKPLRHRRVESLNGGELAC
jgi:nucleoside-diphosphate-sugar epimerase